MKIDSIEGAKLDRMAAHLRQQNTEADAHGLLLVQHSRRRFLVVRPGTVVLAGGGRTVEPVMIRTGTVVYGPDSRDRCEVFIAGRAAEIAAAKPARSEGRP